MYFPFGGSRIYAAEREADGGEPILALARSPDGAWLAALSASSLCVWSGRQHRVVLGHYPRHQASLESDGSNVQLCWHPDNHTLAVSTAGSFVYLYQIQEAASSAEGSGADGGSGGALSAEDCARLLQGQFRVSISLTQKVQAAVQEGAATGAIAAGSAYFWLGVARGVLLAIEWTVQDPTPRKLFLNTAAGADESGTDTAAVIAVCCSSELDLAVGLDVSGRVGYAFGAEQQSGAAVASAPLPLPEWEWGTALAVTSAQRRLCVGCASGALLIYQLRGRAGVAAVAAAGDCVMERKLTLSPWGISPEESGAVAAIGWSDNGLGMGSLWESRASPSLWSLSGSCCTVPSAPMQAEVDPAAAVSGPRALAWAADGLALWTAASGAETTDDRGGVLAETVLVQPDVGRGPCQNEATRRCFHTHDRIFVLTQHSFVATQPTKPDERAVSAVKTRFGWLQVQVPWKYLSENWPVRHVSSSADGSQLAVSGTHGLTLLDTRTKRWRVFGDVSQERELHCVGLAWFRHIVIVYAVMETPPVEDNIWGDSSGHQAQAAATAQLHLYPRKHLDRSSRLLPPASLPGLPRCVDVDEQTGVLATLCEDGSLVLHQLWLRKEEEEGDLTEGREAMVLRAVTILAQCRLDWAMDNGSSGDRDDLSVSTMRLAPRALVVRFVPPVPIVATGAAAVDGAQAVAASARAARAQQMAAEACQLCLMLLRNGQLVLVDTISGVRLCVATGVSDFWLTPAASLPFEDVVPIPLLWCASTGGGVRVCCTGGLADDWAEAERSADARSAYQAVSSTALRTWVVGTEQDGSETWPVGLSEDYGVLLSVGAPGQHELALGRHELLIKQSPVVHHLLRGLLLAGDDAACREICEGCTPAWPSFAASLEWLLLGVLEEVGTKGITGSDAIQSPSALRELWTGDSDPSVGVGVLGRTLALLRCFPQEYEAVIGRCARTMEPSYWRALFSEPPHGAGKPQDLFEACLLQTPPQLRAAAHYLVIIQTMEAEWSSFPPRLVALAQAEGDLKLVAELQQFLKRAEVYAAAAPAAQEPAPLEPRSGAYGRLPVGTPAEEEPEEEEGWLEYLGFA